MRYYVWANESCHNVTEDLEEARRWEKEFLDEGGTSVFIVDEDDNVIYETKNN